MHVAGRKVSHFLQAFMKNLNMKYSYYFRGESVILGKGDKPHLMDFKEEANKI